MATPPPLKTLKTPPIRKLSVPPPLSPIKRLPIPRFFPCLPDKKIPTPSPTPPPSPPPSPPHSPPHSPSPLVEEPTPPAFKTLKTPSIKKLSVPPPLSPIKRLPIPRFF